jgi:hypothetical protein
MENPYEASTSSKSHVDIQSQVMSLERLRSGRTLLIYTLYLNLGLYAAYKLLPMNAIIAFVLGVIVFVMGCISIVKISSGLGHSKAMACVWCISLTVPLVSLLVIVSFLFQAKEALEASGYVVKPFGAAERMLPNNSLKADGPDGPRL